MTICKIFALQDLRKAEIKRQTCQHASKNYIFSRKHISSCDFANFLDATDGAGNYCKILMRMIGGFQNEFVSQKIQDIDE